MVALQVNEESMQDRTHEEAASALKNSGPSVTLVVEYRRQEYDEFQARLQQLQSEGTQSSPPPADGPAPVKQLYVRYVPQKILFVLGARCSA